MKNGLIIIFIFLIISIITFKANTPKIIKQQEVVNKLPSNYINKEGTTIATRAIIPEGFKRDTYTKNSFQEYIRNYPLKPYNTKIKTYDGNLWFNQNDHFGILDIGVPKNGLQQCADALIRLRSEYLWDTNQQEKIGFNFTSGHYCSWSSYAEGYRPKINGNKVSFHKIARANHSKENFYKYLNLIFMYCGTISLYQELPKVNAVSNLQIGDMLIVGGSPGHVAMIADVITNLEGEKKFLLFQGYTPAQSVHLLKNNTTISPWYELQINSEISIPGYTFANSKFVRFK